MFGSKSSNTVEIAVAEGYTPDSFKLKAGQPAKVTFTRTKDVMCTEQVVFRGETYDLPVGEPVTVEFTPDKGDFSFSCGMDMVHGAYKVR